MTQTDEFPALVSASGDRPPIGKETLITAADWAKYEGNKQGDVVVMLWIVLVPSDGNCICSFIMHYPSFPGCWDPQGRLGFNPSCVFGAWNSKGGHFIECSYRTERLAPARWPHWSKAHPS